MQVGQCCRCLLSFLFGTRKHFVWSWISWLGCQYCVLSWKLTLVSYPPTLSWSDFTWPQREIHSNSSIHQATVITAYMFYVYIRYTPIHISPRSFDAPQCHIRIQRTIKWAVGRLWACSAAFIFACLLLSGIILNRVGYYTIPSMEDLAEMVDENGECVVDNFSVGRKGNACHLTAWSVAAWLKSSLLSSHCPSQDMALSFSPVRWTWRDSISTRSSISGARRSLCTQMTKISRRRVKGLTGESTK